MKDDIANGTPSVKEIARGRLREVRVQTTVALLSILGALILALLVWKHLI